MCLDTAITITIAIAIAIYYRYSCPCLCISVSVFNFQLTSQLKLTHINSPYSHLNLQILSLYNCQLLLLLLLLLNTDNATLLPDTMKLKHKPKITKQLSEAIEFRKKYAIDRKSRLEEDRKNHIKMDEFLKPENILNIATKQNSDIIEKELVDNFMNGQIWISNPSKEQLLDRKREEKFHQEAGM